MYEANSPAEMFTLSSRSPNPEEHLVILPESEPRRRLGFPECAILLLLLLLLHHHHNNNTTTTTTTNNNNHTHNHTQNHNNYDDDDNNTSSAREAALASTAQRSAARARSSRHFLSLWLAFRSTCAYNIIQYNVIKSSKPNYNIIVSYRIVMVIVTVITMIMILTLSIATMA